MKMNKILSLVVTAALAVSTLGTALPVFAGSVSGNNGDYTETASGSAAKEIQAVTVTGRTLDEFKEAGLPANFTVQKATVETAVETKLEDKATAVGGKVVASVDIKINQGNITELKKPIPVTVSVAIAEADLKAADVVVIREHNGAIDVLPCYVVGSTVVFESDKFSSFAVALLPKGSFYKTGNGGSSAPAQNPAEPPVDSVPKTGEQLPIVLLGLTVLSAIGCALTFKKKEQN